MTEEQIRALGPAFAKYLQQFDLCFAHPATFGHFGVYCRGLLSDLDRKSVEPIALASGTAVRTLQEFLRDHQWSFRQVRDILQHAILEDLNNLQTEDPDDLGTIGIVDETSVVKKGNKTPGVQRQWCGAVGKIENCVVTVHLGVARGRYKTLLDAELFLPESWANDPQRCAEAHIPEGMPYLPKWRLALRQILRARAVGYQFSSLTFDEGYGSKPGFLDQLDDWNQAYVGEVPCSFSCFTRPPQEGEPGHRADDLARHSPVFYQQEWQEFALPRQTLGPQQWQARMARVWMRGEGGEGIRERGLIVAHNEQTGETKYMICDVGSSSNLGRCLRVAFQRYPVEHSFRLSKSELGFGHYEGRSYEGLMRHMMLCLVTGGFAAKEAASLRGEKSRGDGGASVPSVERIVSSLAGAVTGLDAVGGVGGNDPVSSASEPNSSAVPSVPQRRSAEGATASQKAKKKEKMSEAQIAL